MRLLTNACAVCYTFVYTMASLKKYGFVLFLVVFDLAGLICSLEVSSYTSCVEKVFSADSFVCVCSESYCDGFNHEQARPLEYREFAVYTSSKDGARFEFNVNTYSTDPSGETVLFNVDETVKYQEIIGFGGAFTGTLLRVCEIFVQNYIPFAREKIFSFDISTLWLKDRMSLKRCFISSSLIFTGDANMYKKKMHESYCKDFK